MSIPLDIINVEKSYPVGLRKRKILHGITLQVNPGEVFGFIGPNGAGKSTLINLLMGFTRLDAGDIRIHGLSPRESKARRHLGYLPEGPRFYENLKASELLRFGWAAAGNKMNGADDVIDQLLSQLEIRQVKNRPINTYSKGMKQRLGLAMAMVHDPDTLILDEPMSGLDPLGRNLLKKIILSQKDRGKTIFFSSHILDDVELLCDRIGVIFNGRLLYEGPTKGVIGEKEDIEEAFVRLIRKASKGEHPDG